MRQGDQGPEGGPLSVRGAPKAGGSEAAATPKAREAPASNFLVSAPTLSLPKGGGAIRGIGEKFSANPVTGTGTMSVPIATSPGRSGFGPQLSLSYDSGAGQGPFGLGWSLSLPAISRKTDRGLPRYLDDVDSDTFILAGAEDLVPVLDAATGKRPQDPSVQVSGRSYWLRRYRPRIEGLFARIERWQSVDDPADLFWRTISRDNVTSWFGRTPESRVLDPDHPAHVFQWMLCETHDDKGNVAVYRYQPEDGAGVDRTQSFEANRPVRTGPRRHAATYIARILYGNRTPYLPTLSPADTAWPAPVEDADDWMFEVLFDYGQYPAMDGPLHPEVVISGAWPVRPDPFSTHRAGFEVRTWRLCRRVLMRHHFPGEPTAGAHCLVKSTDFEYGPATPWDLRAPEQPGYATLRTVTHRSYQRGPLPDGAPPGYHWREMPPVGFTYSRPVVGTAVQRIAAKDLPNLPVGTQGPGYQWVDLDGEGLSGVLTEQAGAWHYAANRGNGRFAPTRVVAPLPATAALASGSQQLMDLAGDGEIELVDFSGPTPGFHERDRDAGWKRHVPFANLPQIDWQDPNLRFVDLTGDGHADALVTEHEVFTWYASLEERGFAPAQRTRPGHDEEAGPRVVFHDGAQTLFLADMCGDGLTDLVRIRNGEVCYWPNQGYGRFGRKVTMGNAPRFDAPDQFDPQRLRLADIDGSGPIDLIYLGPQGARLYFNRGGNSFSHGQEVPLPVATANLGAVQVTDLLGTGTACLVWNSNLPADATHPVRYVDLMAEGKPHLLTKVDNHLGATTEIEYTPSTRFYMDDLAAGTPWATRLPFPVHCVSRVIVRDQWRGTAFISRTSYHHGHFDGVEREFRGFGRVEQVDEESFGDPSLDQPPVKTITWFHTGAGQDRRRILTQFASEYFPQRYAERLRDPADPDGFQERPLPEPELPAGMSAEERGEALRACKGMVLRQEVYELEGAGSPGVGGERSPVRLFSAATHNCRIERLQLRGGNRHAVFLVTESEAITYHYELALPADGSPLKPDPRIAHTLNLRHDEYGNLQQGVSIGYPRWKPGDYADLPRPALAHDVQAETHIAYSEVRYTGDVELDAPGTPPAGSALALRHHRLRHPCETLTYELRSIRKSDARYFEPQDFASLDLSEEYGHRPGEVAPGTPVAFRPYHDASVGAAPQRRLVDHVRSLYFDDASDADPPTKPLAFRQHGPRGLKYQDYKLALTRGLLDAVFGTARVDDPLADKLAWGAIAEVGAVTAKSARDLLDDPRRSGYERGEDLVPLFEPAVAGAALAGQYWMRSGIAGFDENVDQSLFLPNRYSDPFGNDSTLTYGPDHLYVAVIEDSKRNSTRVWQFDHRVLAPRELVDISGNRTEVAFDILGLPVAVAVKGKQVGGQWQGGHLGHLDFPLLNPAPKAVADFCLGSVLDEVQARAWLGDATTRFVYHHGEGRDTEGRPTWVQRMAGACAIQCETHAGQRKPGDPPTRLQVALECTDGGGAVLMQKAQAEPEIAGGPLRWIVNGHTVLNNKGKPVRQFEPAFSDRFGCEVPGENGVSTTLFYDGPGRLVRTEFPDGTLNRVAFTPWDVEAWDANDTVLESVWLQREGRGRLPLDEALKVGINGLHLAGPDERAGWLARQHGDTPARTVLDSLGREVISVAHNRVQRAGGPHEFGGTAWADEYHVTFTRLDAEGKPLWIRDARDNLVMQYVRPPKPTRAAAEADPLQPERLPAGSVPCYDIAGNLLHQHSMDAGDRWMLMDPAGQPLLAWDFNERQQDGGAWLQEHRLYVTDYDALRRPTAMWMRVWQRPRPEAPPLPPPPFMPQPRVMLERFEYQDGLAEDTENLNGQRVRHFDTSGLVLTVRRSFTGHVEEVRRQLVSDPRVAWVDWQAEPVADDARLEDATYIQITEHDALGRMALLYNWHRDITYGPGLARQNTPGRTNRVAVYEPRYNERGALMSERLHVRASKTVDARGRVGFTTDAARSKPAIEAISYNARGQKTRVALGNGTVTHYRYDPQNFRLIGLYTRRRPTFTSDSGEHPPRSAAADTDNPPPFCGVQNLRYTYDPAGNITHIRDDAQPTIWFNNQQVPPHCDYRYDGLDRLVEASGRESDQHAGSPPVPEGRWPNKAVPSDDMLRRYTQRYLYDSVGNFVRMEHQAGTGSWTRRYQTALDSNRLLRTWEGDDQWDAGTQKTEYGHDPHGSMLNLKPAGEAFNLHWDQRDMIRHIRLGTGHDAWYQYDSGKQRTRKHITRIPRPNDPDRTILEERIYLGGYELYRRHTGDPEDPIEEIESHHLFEGEQRVLLVDDVILARADEKPGPSGLTLEERTCWRYQYGNHLGSVGVELDEAARVISYEEFHSYGTSAFRQIHSLIEAPEKRYRYTGMERDDETGLDYRAARYGVVELGRWATCDPHGLLDGPNLYAYVGNRPCTLSDPLGGQATTMHLIEGIRIRTVALRGEFAHYDMIGRFISAEADHWMLDPSDFVRGHSPATPHWSSPAGTPQVVSPQTATSNARQSVQERADAQAARARNEQLRASGREGPLEFVREERVDETAPRRMQHGSQLDPAVRAKAETYDAAGVAQQREAYLSRNDSVIAELEGRASSASRVPAASPEPPQLSLALNDPVDKQLKWDFAPPAKSQSATPSAAPMRAPAVKQTELELGSTTRVEMSNAASGAAPTRAARLANAGRAIQAWAPFVLLTTVTETGHGPYEYSDDALVDWRLGLLSTEPPAVKAFRERLLAEEAADLAARAASVEAQEFGMRGASFGAPNPASPYAQ